MNSKKQNDPGVWYSLTTSLASRISMHGKIVQKNGLYKLPV